MRAYHFLSAKYAIENIKKQRIKISLVPDLNDPFELYTFPLTTTHHRRIWRRTVRDVGLKFGVICFSRSWDNPVVWAHYAEKHYGICLGFDIADEWTKEINYQQSMIPISIDTTLPNGGFDEETMQKVLYTKYSGWSYENEIRVQANLVNAETNPEDPTKLIYFADFGEKIQLKEVIVGVRSLVSKAELEAALQEYQYDVKIIKARMAFQSFRVVPNLKGFIQYQTLRV